MIKHILVPLDGSDYSEQALPYAKNFAEGRDVNLLLARAPAIPTPVLEDALVDETQRRRYLDAIHTSIGSYLEELRSDLQAEGFQVRSKILEGPVTEAILKVVHEEAIDLIVMSTRGENAPHGHYGSVAERVHKNAACPSLLVPVVFEADDEED